MRKEPDSGQVVEVFHDGVWKRAKFHCADFIATDEDEIWWMDHFQLDDGDTIPEDTRSGWSEVPEWRKIRE